ncbi:MAG: PIN domain-containing protein, partial [Pseudomonadales bacterium]|nr:PIN domain-containing protein [Pseudomonadales bacterium]
LTDLFKAYWSDDIHEEWITAVLRQGKHSKERLERARDLMDLHVREAKVVGYENLIETLDLPDPDDRHVLAAAIRCNADAIVTFNQKDFPEEALKQYAIDIIHPDDFIFYQLDMAAPICCKAIRSQRLALKNPEMSIDDFLAVLQKQQLPQTVSKLREYLEFL